MVSGSRNRVATVHYAKERAKTDNPWTLEIANKTVFARKIVFQTLDPISGVPVDLAETVFRPEKETNPRAWIRLARARVDTLGTCHHNLGGCIHVLLERH